MTDRSLHQMGGHSQHHGAVDGPVPPDMVRPEEALHLLMVMHPKAPGLAGLRVQSQACGSVLGREPERTGTRPGRCSQQDVCPGTRGTGEGQASAPGVPCGGTLLSYHARCPEQASGPEFNWTLQWMVCFCPRGQT